MLAGFKVFKAIYGSYKNIMRSYLCEEDYDKIYITAIP
ncbi:hypothetical protein ANAPC5_00762 [Anaplasma phagocytophilum]|nr:hypothetical protein ANAPC2_00696 [Anaplasma phagocytophilum]SBO32109.1 hypothetical protein ANAPC4_00699 [Anaplasma phagocytophilum]SBO32646.1 hypothetical protein ANAPC3_00934 [Anaplasma phagocytophilum]SCV64084.1 hypothetical protein ANAPC5_00762 [Anaplasma phagocytophilum]